MNNNLSSKYMLTYQWTDGSSPERSKREQKTVQTPNSADVPILDQTNEHIYKNVAESCIISKPSVQIFHDPNHFRNMDNVDFTREESHFKIAERDMMCQTGQNPFFSSDVSGSSATSYADHVSLQDKFLKPISTIYTDKTKNKSNEIAG